MLKNIYNSYICCTNDNNWDSSNTSLTTSLHSKLENRSDSVYLKTWLDDVQDDAEEATVFVNGQLISGEVCLNHGDRVIFGGSHYFRLVSYDMCCFIFGTWISRIIILEVYTVPLSSVVI